MSTKKVAIIGAGLAGCSLAYELSRSNNFDIIIFDKNSEIANEASGNFAGILEPYLTSDNNFSDQFHTLGYSLLLDFINQYVDEVEICNKGVLQILSDEKDLKRYEKIFHKRDIDPNLAQILSNQQLSRFLNKDLSKKAIYYSNALSVVPKSICHLWLKLSGAKLKIDAELLDIKNIGEVWQLEFAEFSEDFDIVIFAGGYHLFKNISYLQRIPVYPSYGQLTVIDNYFDIDRTIVDKGYIIPGYQGDLQVIGATFRDNSDISGELRDTDDEFNISQIKQISLNNHDKELDVVNSRVAMRCVTSDHLPLIGELVDYIKFEETFYKPLSKGYPKSKMPKVEYETGLYVSSGFGSKGMCSSLIAAKIIASKILDQQNIVSKNLLEALSPQRFWIRNFKKSLRF
ncbi:MULTISPECIES: FAD-dependent 5-carboxymethylaminomethyl-2-thiouridine(34) oxidoreductase MnmC [unclassified Francisella]|uniref:FAD-dependent 5-carboxymethylaminomethyl-2-thiouridine(34) oxidoreductase MnmC n=1 Tax=unclassified Francisella TaxID=2610885 RepID=UPI002E3240EA|nr:MULTISPECIES: FAD-dependent 5-carboxymethylaminomethyl-2-thiouridine(34) oxidoreductase MnmC [unclassified Francisella]MED7819297.1 FAD-dependent 5-carboxymethylaminomethyl-2-thiouridine(34) oxidoreductase MnmC [Francisella sp. 19S2-4]MED7830073.1 FAD-dependent 5-carboxymethylaminomethyl-2-thiouridine(34) oxidoreductase MnmC [Francisella sp. 19S2-10]